MNVQTLAGFAEVSVGNPRKARKNKPRFSRLAKLPLLALVTGMAVLSVSCASLLGAKIDQRFKGKFEKRDNSRSLIKSGAYYNSGSSYYTFEGRVYFLEHISSSKIGAYTGHKYESSSRAYRYEIELSEQTPQCGLYRTRGWDVSYWKWREWPDEWLPYEWSPDGNAVRMASYGGLFYKDSFTKIDSFGKPKSLHYYILEKIGANAQIPESWK